MPITQPQKSHLQSLCPNIHLPGTHSYHDKAAPWSNFADKHPSIVVEPTTLSEMTAVISYLYQQPSIDFCIRNTGTGGASATDVCVNMHGFKQFEWDPKSETAVVGAGLSWGELDQLMEERTDGFACVGARCTWVGVTGGALVGGLSWLSHEWGMISDPQNLLDAQVVLHDGRVVWAAQEEPELMWALRGGGGNFGVVTALKLRAYKTTPKIFAGIVLIPYSSLAEASAAIAAISRRPEDPKVAMHIVNQGPGMGQPDQGAKPGIAIMPIDFRGEAHARSEEGFAWVWKITSAHELIASTFTYASINALSDSFKDYQNKNMFWLSAPLISRIEDDTLIRAWKWYEDAINQHPGFGVGSTVLLEFMQEKAFNSSGGRDKTAWPHSGRKHVMQLVLGCEPDSLPANERQTSAQRIRDLAMRLFAKAAVQISPEHHAGEWHAGFLHDWNDLSKVYGENYPKLKELKKRYDPANRFNKGVDLTEGRVTPGMTV